MNGTVKPIRSESARFLVGGTRKGQGVVLLYPDKLASVREYAEMWGYFVGPFVVAAAALPIARITGAWIPLDMVASLQTFRPTRLGSLFSGETLVVTTVDGTEYGFRGRTGLQNDIAGALAGLGREVRATTTGLAVSPRALNGEG